MHIYASIPTTPVWGVYLHRHTSMNYELHARLSPSTSLDHQHLRVMLQTNEHKVASDQSSDPPTLPPVHCRVLVYVPSRFPALPAAPEHTSGLLPAGRPASLSPGQTGWTLRCCRAADVFSACLLWSACRDSGLDFGVNSGCEFLNSQYSRKRNRMLLLLGGNWEEELR